MELQGQCDITFNNKKKQDKYKLIQYKPITMKYSDNKFKISDAASHNVRSETFTVNKSTIIFFNDHNGL